MNRPLRVLHPITRLIIGGAQENTVLTADAHLHDPAFRGRYEVSIVCGPQTGPEGSLIPEARDRGISVTVLPQLRREISPVNDLVALARLRKMMRSGRFDIVHTHSSKAGILGRFAAASVGVPVVVHTVHGWSFHDQMNPLRIMLFVLLERAAARYSQSIIVVSRNDIDKGLAQGIGKSEDYTVIRSGIELDRFGHPQIGADEVRRDLGIPDDALVIGSVTRLSPQKAPLDLIDAFAIVRRSFPKAVLLIVGDGPLREQVEQRLAETGLAEATILAGLRRDVPELLASFDLFALTSLWEGLPRVLPQAMATGLPIVCTRADGSAEAVIEGETGFLVDRGDAIAMAARINQLLADEALRRRLGESGRARAPIFDAAKMAADIDALYRRLGGW